MDEGKNMKVEYELQVSGVGYPIEYVREGISDTLMLYAGGYGLAVMAIKAALSHGYPVVGAVFLLFLPFSSLLFPSFFP